MISLWGSFQSECAWVDLFCYSHTVNTIMSIMSSLEMVEFSIADRTEIMTAGNTAPQD